MTGPFKLTSNFSTAKNASCKVLSPPFHGNPLCSFSSHPLQSLYITIVIVTSEEQ
jgi:hypothetical protein